MLQWSNEWNDGVSNKCKKPKKYLALEDQKIHFYNSFFFSWLLLHLFLNSFFTTNFKCKNLRRRLLRGPRSVWNKDGQLAMGQVGYDSCQIWPLKVAGMDPTWTWFISKSSWTCQTWPWNPKSQVRSRLGFNVQKSRLGWTHLGLTGWIACANSTRNQHEMPV